MIRYLLKWKNNIFRCWIRSPNIPFHHLTTDSCLESLPIDILHLSNTGSRCSEQRFCLLHKLIFKIKEKTFHQDNIKSWHRISALSHSHRSAIYSPRVKLNNSKKWLNIIMSSFWNKIVVLAANQYSSLLTCFCSRILHLRLFMIHFLKKISSIQRRDSSDLTKSKIFMYD